MKRILLVCSLLAVASASVIASERTASSGEPGLDALSHNGVALNRLAFNRLAFNRLAFNRLAFNRLALNGLTADDRAMFDTVNVLADHPIAKKKH